MSDTTTIDARQEVDDTSTDVWDRKRVAQSIVNRSSAMAAGAGLIPSPVVDLAALFGVQLNMINRLCHLYDVPFSQEAGKNVLLSVISTSLPFTGLKYSVATILKAIPFVGSLAGMATMPALGAGATYGLGQVLIRHYESGGNLLNFDARKSREYFQRTMAEGRQLVTV